MIRSSADPKGTDPQMSELLPIIGDTPSAKPGLGFKSYTAALASAIRGGQPAQFTIGIYGAWGSGKSSLLNAIGRELERHDDVLQVTFDAWRYERADHIIVPLLHRLHTAIPKLGDKTITEKVRRALMSVVRSVTFQLGPVSVDPSKAVNSNEQDYLAGLDAAYAQPYADMRAIGEALGDRRRVAVLIDDLDRCSPHKVVSLLEAINLVMDVPGFVFVLALDYDVLVKAVSDRYPYASGHVFIEKMVQVPFRVPRLDLPPTSFLHELIPGWERYTAALPSSFSNIAYDVATLALEANPRQVKRFVNSLLVLLRVAEERLTRPDPRLLAGLVGLQLRWPAEYQDLATAVYADDSNPTDPLLNEQQPELAKYARGFFEPGHTADDLKVLLQLTESVGSPDSYSPYEAGEYSSGLQQSAAKHELREHRYHELLAALQQNGFHESSRWGDSYQHNDLPNYRVKFGTTAVRFEVKGGDGQWKLGVSLSLSRESKKALELIFDRDALRTAVDRGVTLSYPDTVE